jgi:hypothetical protein
MGFCFVYKFLAPIVNAIYSSETSLEFHRNTWRYIPEDIIIHGQCYENLNSKDKYPIRNWNASLANNSLAAP